MLIETVSRKGFFWGAAVLLLVLLLCGTVWIHRQETSSAAVAVWHTPYTLVLDAGHGGFDGGAVGANGVSEQDINLRIAKKTQALCGFFGIPTVMTRENEHALDYEEGRSVRENKVADIKAREKCVENVENPIFFSIHLNKFEDAQYHGAQVFYSANHNDSRVIAERMQETLRQGLNPDNNRKAKQAVSSIYLMRKLVCPAVIVECGFLSNPGEAQLLTQDAYQTRLAVCIVDSYLAYLAGDAQVDQS